MRLFNVLDWLVSISYSLQNFTWIFKTEVKKRDKLLIRNHFQSSMFRHLFIAGGVNRYLRWSIFFKFVLFCLTLIAFVKQCKEATQKIDLIKMLETKVNIRGIATEKSIIAISALMYLRLKNEEFCWFYFLFTKYKVCHG